MIAREAMLALFVGVGATAMPVAVLVVARAVADFLYETLPSALGSPAMPAGGSGAC